MTVHYGETVFAIFRSSIKKLGPPSTAKLPAQVEPTESELAVGMHTSLSVRRSYILQPLRSRLKYCVGNYLRHTGRISFLQQLGR